MRKLALALATAALALAATGPAHASTVGPNATAPQPPNGKALVYNDWGSKSLMAISRYGSNPWNDIGLDPGQGYSSTFSYGVGSGYFSCVEDYTGYGWVNNPGETVRGPAAVVPPAYTTKSVRLLIGSGTGFNCPHW